MILIRLIHPPKGILYFFPPIVFSALIFIFVFGKEESLPAYVIFGMSAYSLVIWLVALPKVINRIKYRIINTKAAKKLLSYRVINRYFTDLSFKGRLSICQGMTVNFLYAFFRIFTGIFYSSVLFLSVAVYHLALGCMRVYLICAYKKRDTNGMMYEYGCYRKIAWLLLLLNIPMGGMILLLVKSNSDFIYPGYTIYLSALHTFYTVGISNGNLLRYRKFGSPILSAAKVLNFVSAMMSVFSLQAAMLTAFSKRGEEGFGRMMNTATGGVIFGAVIVIAVCMIVNASIKRKRGRACEQIGEQIL